MKCVSDSFCKMCIMFFHPKGTPNLKNNDKCVTAEPGSTSLQQTQTDVGFPYTGMSVLMS